MTDKFWKLIASCAVVGLFYVGHALHQQYGVDSFPSFSKSAFAEGIAVENGRVITTSPDGRHVHFWFLTGNRIQYGSSASVPDEVK